MAHIGDEIAEKAVIRVIRRAAGDFIGRILAQGVGLISGLGVPGADGPHDNRVTFVPRQGLDGRPTFCITFSIVARCNRLGLVGARFAGLFSFEVHLIADQPDRGPRRVTDEIGRPPGKIVVL